jgi:anti-sigma factor RsiW
MDLRCANFETLLAMVQGRLAAPDLELVSRHLVECSRCTAELESIESTRLVLSALHAAELNAAQPRTSWADVAATAERPPFLMRLPAALTDAVRTSRTLAQPAIAGALAAVVLGLSLGTWLALATQRSTATAEAADTYSASSLLDSPSSGIADVYFDSQDATPAAGVDAGGADAGDSGSAPASKSQSGDSTGGEGR